MIYSGISSYFLFFIYLVFWTSFLTRFLGNKDFGKQLQIKCFLVFVISIVYQNVDGFKLFWAFLYPVFWCISCSTFQNIQCTIRPRNKGWLSQKPMHIAMWTRICHIAHFEPFVCCFLFFYFLFVRRKYLKIWLQSSKKHKQQYQQHTHTHTKPVLTNTIQKDIPCPF